MTRIKPERNTNQLTAWRNLVEALEQVDAAWKATQPTGTRFRAPTPCRTVMVARTLTQHAVPITFGLKQQPA